MESQNQKVAIIVVCTGGSWETVYGVLRYKPVGLPKRILQIPLNLTYSGLMTRVSRKLNLSLHSSFRMTYQFPLSSSNRNKTVVVDIADEEDVEVFMDTVLKSSHGVGLITLYVVEAAPSRRDQPDTGNSGGKQPVFTYQQLFPEQEAANLAGTSRKHIPVESEDDYEDLSDLFGDQTSVDPFKYPCKLELGVGGNADNDTDGKDVGKGFFRWFDHTGPPASAPESSSRTYKEFSSKEALKLTLKLKCLEEGFKIKTTRSTKDRYEVRCVSDACDWRISGTRKQGSDVFVVKDFKVQHKCSRPR